MISNFNRRILRRISRPIQVNGVWRIQLMHVKRLQWAVNVVRMFVTLSQNKFWREVSDKGGWLRR
jgi:hypothetical protein